MSSVSNGKRTAKRTRPANSSSSSDSEIEAVETSQIKLCTICGGPPAKITKDSNYDIMMQLYWCTVGIDVKPDVCSKTDACERCFSKVVKYFETNDIITYFENYIKSLRSDLLKKTLKGLTVSEKKGASLNSIQKQIKEKYGSYAEYKDIDERETAGVKNTLAAYKVETYEVLSEDEGKLPKAPRSGMKLTRLNEERSKPKPKVSLKNKSSCVSSSPASSKTGSKCAKSDSD